MDNLPTNPTNDPDNSLATNYNYRGKIIAKSQLDSFPHHCIGLVHIRDKEGTYRFGTGFLTNSWFVLTAATTLFKSGKFSIDPQSVEFCLDLHGDLISSTRIKVKKVTCSPRYEAIQKHMSIIDPHS
jgi:hypothetical protein